MHRALLIAEIFRSICDVTDERTLFRLACCCKATHEPAKQALWRIIPNLVPLIKCFPTDVWTTEDHKIKFTRVPRPEEWSVFLRNARLVRYLGYVNHPRPCGLHDNAMEILGSVRPILVLFPQIRVLKWDALELGGRYLPFILSMIGDLVTTVDINHSIPEVILCASIAMIAPRLRHLRNIHLDPFKHATHDATSSAMVSALLCTLTSLTTFDSCSIPLTLNAIRTLAELKTIRNLHFHLPLHGTDWSSVRFPAQSFTSLTQLSLSFVTEAYIAFSRTVALPHLEALVLYVGLNLEPELISELFISVRRQCSPASLRYLFLRQVTVYPEIDEMQYDVLRVVSGADLQPLWDFTRMEAFELSIQCDYVFDDAFLLDLANAWPQLRELDLAMEEFCFQDVPPSLTGLLPIVVGCPSLESLWLQFDASGDITEELYSRVADIAATSRVTHLNVGNSPITHPRSVALFLALAFPEVEYFCYGDRKWEDVLRWEEVHLYLPMFKSVREHERLRMERKMKAETATSQS